MNAFDEIKDKIRRKERVLEASEIKARLKELESELEKIPVTPTCRHTESAPATSEHTHSLLKQMSDVGKSALIVFSVIMVIRVAAWVGFATMVAALVWCSYKFLSTTSN